MKLLKNIMKLFLGVYILVIVILYFAQEKLLFFPTKLEKEYKFKFHNEFEEINLLVENDVELNMLEFKSKKPKGVVLFFHGNGGAINGWGKGANLYLKNNYDVVYMDYRGYGKSDGAVKSEQQLIEDGQKIYDYLKDKFKEENIIISGTSIGSGIAVQVAVKNNPKELILNSPYSSLELLIKEKVKIVPKIIIKYKLKTINHLEKTELPITIFHGSKDQLIPHQHSLALKEKYPKIKLHILEGYGHNNTSQSPTLIDEMNKILTR